MTMESLRKEQTERPDEERDRTGRVLLEIAEDARALKDRYPSETLVPEGGE